MCPEVTLFFWAGDPSPKNVSHCWVTRRVCEVDDIKKIGFPSELVYYLLYTLKIVASFRHINKLILILISLFSLLSYFRINDNLVKKILEKFFFFLVR